MTFDMDLHEVHALALVSAATPLRERQILMVQQGLHNAGFVTSEERRDVITTCTGRVVTDLRDLHQSELRPILKHLHGKNAARAQ